MTPSDFDKIKQAAKEELRYRKVKRNKDLKLPCYEVGDKVVLCANNFRSKDRKYLYVEIIDFKERSKGNFIYFCVTLNASKDKHRIGRLEAFHEGYAFLSEYQPAHVAYESINWDPLAQKNL